MQLVYRTARIPTQIVIFQIFARNFVLDVCVILITRNWIKSKDDGAEIENEMNIETLEEEAARRGF